jgi:hypothetical protein
MCRAQALSGPTNQVTVTYHPLVLGADTALRVRVGAEEPVLALADVQALQVTASQQNTRIRAP